VKQLKPGEQRKPNLLLREQRLLRGWSLQRVVEELCALSSVDNRLPGVNAPMVSNWETGTKKPSPFYRERLCKLYNMTADQLGFMDSAVFHPEPSIGTAPDSTANNGHYDARLIHSILPAGNSKPAPSTRVIPYEQIKAVGLLNDGTEHTHEEQLSAWLALGANHLSMLLDAGWSPEKVLDSVRVVLQGMQGLPGISRRELLEIRAGATFNDIPILTDDRIVQNEQLRATEALSKSISDGWKLFHHISTNLLFAIAESQLLMMQRVHTLLFPPVRCMFYSSIYRLKGAALFFLARYSEAMKAFNQSYIAALEANDPWNMAESLSWQGGVWKAFGRQDKAIQATEAALRLTYVHEERSLPLRARLYAHWAESAALLHQSHIMMEKLDAAAELLESLEPNEEFDHPTWKQYRAICHFYNGDLSIADRYFQQALEEMNPNWILQKGYTLLLQAQTRLKMGEIDQSITVARIGLPFITTINSPLINRGLMDYVQELTRFADNKTFQAFHWETQPLALHTFGVIPRYLEAKT
jgi:tetratricopeptide (TPR) repeat protein/transcriptional regulator with XRE-family HTH domain